MPRQRWSESRTSDCAGESATIPVNGCAPTTGTTLKTESWSDISWRWRGLQTGRPPNLQLQLGGEVRLRGTFPKSGQKRVDQLFRDVQGRIVGRQVVLTVAQEDDAPKRARAARLDLQPEGILVLGHQDAHPVVAVGLVLPVPVKSEWIIAVRVVPVDEADERRSVPIADQRWAVAQPQDPVVAAPYQPKKLTP